MAKTGLEYICIGFLQEDGTYKDGRYIGPSAKFSASPTTNSVKDFGDNRAVETDTSVTTGTVSLEINEFENETCSVLLGHTYDEEKDMVTCNANDKAPYIGVACMGRSTGKKPYKAVVYKKIQCKEPTDEYETQQDQLTYSHTTLEGDFYTMEDGGYSIKAGFDTRDEAKAFIDELFNITTATEPENGTEGA